MVALVDVDHRSGDAARERAREERCGRTDLPGGDPEALYESLTQKLAKVPDTATLFPGHLYSPEPSASMADTRATNYVFRPRSLDQWLQMFGAG